MALRLYYGGIGDTKEFVIAESEEQAILKVGKKLNVPFLPITVKEISEVDGYEIVVKSVDNKTESENAATGAVLRHCKLCDFSCENQGELLRHYRECHPKGE